jgi:hypothetical protein
VTTPPSQWLDGLLKLAFTLLAIAVILSIAAHLIESVLPVLVGLGVVVLLGFVGWSLYQFYKTRW